MSLVAFSAPLPIPTATPTVPLPLPTLPALLGSGSGTVPTQQAASPPRSGPAQRPASAAGTSASTLTAGPAPALASGDQAIAATAAATATSSHSSGPLATGGTPGTPGAPPPLEPGLLFAALAVTALLLARRVSTASVARRRRLRITVAAAGEAPLQAALDAACCLLESLLPEGAAVKRLGPDALAITSSSALAAAVDSALPKIAQRARRVGLELTWPAAPSQPAPVLAAA